MRLVRSDWVAAGNAKPDAQAKGSKGGPFYAKPTDVVRATSMSLDECLELL